MALVFTASCLVAASGAAALESEPVPPRVPRPYLAIEPWAGFWPGPQGTSQHVYLDSHAQFAQWERLRKALSERGAPAMTEATSPEPGEAFTREPLPAGDPLYWETPAFREAWTRALDLARAGNGEGAQAVLEANPANTLEGERLARRLLFAITVTGENREEADSLYYRLSWEDGGRTASRLHAWRALEEGRPGEAVSSLESLFDPSEGEGAALALARWRAEPRVAGPEPLAGVDAPVLARNALNLARMRWALLENDPPTARAAWRDIVPETLPEAWRATYDRMTARLGEGGDAPPAEEDALRYREAAQAFLSQRDAETEALLTEWLGAWPVSPLRANAYLLRAHVRTASGRLPDAEADLRAAERLAESAPVADRGKVVRAFIAAQRGKNAEAQSLLRGAIMSSLGEVAEGELRFDQTRLARLAGDEAGVQSLILQLEEGFPGEPWVERARDDRDPEGWRAPYRSLPREPQGVAALPAPAAGPWARLIWGETFLAEEAQQLERLSAREAGWAAAVPPPAPRPTSPRASGGSAPMAFVDLGLGGPAALILGGGIAGLVGDVAYRADLAKILAQERNELPEYRRTDWQAGLGMRSGDWRLGAAVEGTARTDGDAPRLGLSPGQVESSWWGIRGDVGMRAPEESGFRLSGSLVQGEVEVGNRGRWETDQAWFAVNGGHWLGGARWDAGYSLGFLDYSQPVRDTTASAGFADETDSPAYHTLRVTRNMPGGWYVGGKAGLYQKRVLILPVAGVTHDLGSGITVWAGSEPSLSLPNFRETFVSNGDWMLPDLSLPAERRYLDLRGGIRMGEENAHSLAVSGEVFRTDLLRTWRKGSVGLWNGLWEEVATSSDATGVKLTVSGSVALGPVGLAARGDAARVRADGAQIPYVPRHDGSLELSYAHEGWRWVLTLFGVNGREDEFGVRYGDFLRWDLDFAYRFPNRSLPMGFRNMEVAVGLDNLTDVKDRRWPGVPAYGFGVVIGVRALYGS
jgi:hypothetical protein